MNKTKVNNIAESKFSNNKDSDNYEGVIQIKTAIKKRIILTSLDNISIQEVWGALTEVCDNHPEFKIRAINTLKFPFEYKGWQFNKVPYNQKHK